MVVDTSALIAILLGEREAETVVRAMLNDPRKLMSSFTVLETAIVIEARKGPEGGRELELLMYNGPIEVIPFTAAQQTLALEAWRKYGKSRHPARLNIGDCCSYALAKFTGEPLLFKGDDFRRTDISCIEY